MTLLDSLKMRLICFVGRGSLSMEFDGGADGDGFGEPSPGRVFGAVIG